MATLVVGIVVLAILGFSIYTIYKDKKSSSGGCGCGCSGCGGACHSMIEQDHIK